jgi:hypothetical protein
VRASIRSIILENSIGCQDRRALDCAREVERGTGASGSTGEPYEELPRSARSVCSVRCLSIAEKLRLGRQRAESERTMTTNLLTRIARLEARAANRRGAPAAVRLDRPSSIGLHRRTPYRDGEVNGRVRRTAAATQLACLTGGISSVIIAACTRRGCRAGTEVLAPLNGSAAITAKRISERHQKLLGGKWFHDEWATGRPLVGVS